MFLALLMTGFGTEIRSLMIAQTVIVSLSVVILYWLARQILPPAMAFVGAFLAALSPWGAARAGFLLSDGLFLLMLALLFLVMYLVVQYARTTKAILIGGCFAGLMTSAVIFIRPVFPLIALVAVTMFALSPLRRIYACLLVGAMIVCAVMPLHFWKMRNMNEAQFDGFSDVSGKAAWQWLASAVKGQVQGTGGDRWMMLRKAEEEETHWRFSLQQADAERWRLAKDVFRAHPFLTVYVFLLNAGEALIHPQPGILTPARLNFSGDTIVLGGMWLAFVFSAALGTAHVLDRAHSEAIARNWLLAMLIICGALTMTGGVSFGAGARYRIPLELIVPLLAGVGLVHITTGLKKK